MPAVSFHRYYSRVWSALARVLGPVDTQAVGTPQFDKVRKGSSLGFTGPMQMKRQFLSPYAAQ
jgi:hypothetical protein